MDVSPVRQVESPILELVSVSWQGPRRGPPEVGSGGEPRGAHPVAVDLPSRVSAPECKASAEKERASRAVRQEKGNLLEQKERMAGP